MVALETLAERALAKPHPQAGTRCRCLDEESWFKMPEDITDWWLPWLKRSLDKGGNSPSELA